jgi:hypothetical protein
MITEMTNDRAARIRAYEDAIAAHKAADAVLSALLTVKYGKRAGDMRYAKPETAEIAAAMRAKRDASEAQQTAWLAWLATMQG